MKNFIAAGESLALTAPAGGVEAGTPVIIGGLLVVPKFSQDEGLEFTALWGGVFTFKKTTGDITALLQPAYWDGEVKEFTTTATDKRLSGVFYEAAPSDATEVQVLLTGEVA